MIRRPDERLCWSFRDLARWTMKKVGSSWGHGISFGEETITESLLLQLAEWYAPHELRIKTWTKPEEGTGTRATGGLPTGADWDFWIADGTGQGIHLRSQAKRQFSSGHYESLDGAGQQIQDLRNNCSTAIPLYVFYNGPWHGWSKAPCSRYCGPRFSARNVWGCAIAPVSGIPTIVRPHPDQISSMRPWHCLVCPCPLGTGSGSLPQRIASVLRALYEEAGGGDRLRDASPLSFELSITPPPWVPLLQGAIQDSSAIEQYLDKNGLRGVALVRQIAPILE